MNMLEPLEVIFLRQKFFFVEEKAVTLNLNTKRSGKKLIFRIHQVVAFIVVVFFK